MPFALETIFAERLYYTSSLGLVFLVVWLLQQRWPVLTRRLLWALLGAWLVASGWTTVYRMGIWQNNRTLFCHDAAVHDRSLRLLQMAAGQYEIQEPKRHDLFLRCIRRILTLEPNFPAALHAMSREAVAAGDLDAALELLRRGRNSPLLMIVDKAEDAPKLYHDLGVVLAAKGRRQEASQSYLDAIEFANNYHPAREKLIRMAVDDNDLAEAERLLAEGERIDPRHDPWKIHRGVLAYRRGDHATAARILAGVLPRATRKTLTFTDWLALADALGKSGRKRDGLHMLEYGIQMWAGVPPEHLQAVHGLRQRLLR
ncbi:MAG: hypothetical protein V3U11_13085 [Planctomycetota bacterium]